MRITRTQQIGSFAAADGRGIRCIVFECQEDVRLPVAGSGDAWVPRRRSLQLANGNPVDLLSDGSLRVAPSGAKLHRLN